MDKIIMTKSELIKLGEEFCKALESEFEGNDIISVDRDGFDYYRGSPMYGCIVSVDPKNLTDEKFNGIKHTIDSACNRWDEHTDYGWNDDSSNFWVAIYIDEIAPDPVNEDVCPECGEDLEDNGEGVMYCPFCHPEMSVMECEECGTDLEEDEDGNMYCPNCRAAEMVCEECGTDLEEDEDGNMYCPRCKEEEMECEECGAEKEEDEFGNWYCPECRPHCPECEEPLDEDGECPECGWAEEECEYCGEHIYNEEGAKVCHYCGWDENYDGDGDRCPECDKLTIEEDGVQKCPHCNWDERDDWDDDQWAEYNANR